MRKARTKMNYNATNAGHVKQWLEEKGVPPHVICAILSNTAEESGIEPKNVQNSFNRRYGITDDEYTQRVDLGTYKHPQSGANFISDKVGYGLVQWTSSGRKNGLYLYCKSQNTSIGNLKMQVGFMMQEFATSYKKVYQKMLDANSPYDAAVAMVCEYEVPESVLNKDTKPQTCERRGQLAQEFYARFYGGSNMDTKILALSAGHYLYTTGKRCAKQLDPTETREWTLNARVCDKVATGLNRYEGVKILRLDDPTGEKGISIENRAKMSDQNHADFYLAVHHNAAGRIFNGGGVVVYHYPLERNKAQATDLYNRLIAHNGLKGNRAKPIVATNNLYEVTAPKADSLLIENGFMDSTHDVPIILTEEFAQQTADAIVEFFVNMWSLQLKQEQSKSDILAEIESITANIKALEKRKAELEALL